MAIAFALSGKSTEQQALSLEGRGRGVKRRVRRTPMIDLLCHKSPSALGSISVLLITVYPAPIDHHSLGVGKGFFNGNNGDDLFAEVGELIGHRGADMGVRKDGPGVLILI